MDSLFYSSMSSVLSQWSDFRVSKHLYKAYYNMKKSENSSDKQTSRREITYKNSFNTNKLGDLSSGVTKAVSDLESAFAVQNDTGEIDTEKAYSAAESFVNSYNDLVSNIKQSGNAQISSKQQFIANMTTAYAKRLENVGITVDSSGKMSIDKEKFESAGADDYDKIFGKNASFASFMSSQASQLAKINVSESSSSSTYSSSGTKNNSLTSGELLNMLS